jgi:hypothetical protein
LNRNFLAPAGGHAGSNPDYLKVDALLNPRSVPGNDLFYIRAASLVARCGMAKLRLAVVGGQGVNPQGLFYRGVKLEAGPAAYQGYLEEKLAHANRIVAIDVHTGFGRYGEDMLLVDAAKERARVNLAMRETFGARVQPDDNEDVAYRVRGAHYDMYYRSFPLANTYFATQEFGTFHALRTLAALRAENRWHQYGSSTLAHPAKKQLLAVFCPRDEIWRGKVLSRGREVLDQACGLAFDKSPRE